MWAKVSICSVRTCQSAVEVAPCFPDRAKATPLRPDGDSVLSLWFHVITLLGKGDILWH